MRKVRRRTQRKLKVVAVDAAMIFLASQLTVVLRDDAGSMAAPDQSGARVEAAVLYEYPEEEKESETSFFVHSRDWDSEDGEILLKIAMAEAEGEGVEGKAYVMMVVLNRVWSDDFPGTIKDVVFQEGQFTPVEDGGRYWTTEPDAECCEAYKMVLHGWDKSEGALYFCADRCSSWMEENTEYLYTVGNHSFYR